MSTPPPLKRAIAHTGSQRKLAAALGIDESNVSAWVRGRKPVPYKHRLAIEALTRNGEHHVSAFDFD